MQRRLFLKSGGLAIAGLGLAGALPGVLQPLAGARPATPRPKVLVVVFQRGAVDGLSMVVPHGDPAYHAARPRIAVPRPGADGGALDLDGHFGLHPEMAPLLPLWRAQRMAVVHAVGSHDATRSHFDAQDYMETATPGAKATRDGWLNRVLQARAAPGVFGGVAMAAQMPRALAGRAPAVAMSDLSRFALQAGARAGGLHDGFEQLWRESADALGPAGRETLEAVELLKRSGAASRPVEHGARYPDGDFGRAMRQIAQLIKTGVGLQLAFAESGGWDTHVNQGGSRGQLAVRLREFAHGLAAFLADLGPARDNVLLLTMSEFGRTVRENGSRGTDHGHGNAMLAFGAGVRGGRVLGDWPGLDAPALYEGRDLAVTTDFRAVLSEVAQRHLGIDASGLLFPGYADGPAAWRSVLG